MRSNLIHVVGFCIALSGCIDRSAVYSTIPCVPPSDLLVKQEESLPSINVEELTVPEIIEYWMTDDSALIKERQERNALVNHIQIYCSGAPIK